MRQPARQPMQRPPARVRLLREGRPQVRLRRRSGRSPCARGAAESPRRRSRRLATTRGSLRSPRRGRRPQHRLLGARRRPLQRSRGHRRRGGIRLRRRRLWLKPPITWPASRPRHPAATRRARTAPAVPLPRSGPEHGVRLKARHPVRSRRRLPEPHGVRWPLAALRRMGPAAASDPARRRAGPAMAEMRCPAVRCPEHRNRARRWPMAKPSAARSSRRRSGGRRPVAPPKRLTALRLRRAADRGGCATGAGRRRSLRAGRASSALRSAPGAWPRDRPRQRRP